MRRPLVQPEKGLLLSIRKRNSPLSLCSPVHSGLGHLQQLALPQWLLVILCRLPATFKGEGVTENGHDVEAGGELKHPSACLSSATPLSQPQVFLSPVAWMAALCSWWLPGFGRLSLCLFLSGSQGSTHRTGGPWISQLIDTAYRVSRNTLRLVGLCPFSVARNGGREGEREKCFPN